VVVHGEAVAGKEDEPRVVAESAADEEQRRPGRSPALAGKREGGVTAAETATNVSFASVDICLFPARKELTAMMDVGC
jgi:hypothetical protein